MSHDPLYPRADRAPSDLPKDAYTAMRRLSLLRIATGLLALALLGAIWITWRWG